MNTTKEQIITDLKTLDSRNFYKKYIVKSNNWYLSNVLNIPEENIVDAIDTFRDIVSTNLQVSFNSIMMVGSGKIGYSLSPSKNLKPFTLNPTDSIKSDIDIAIIASDIFEYFWKLFRKAYSLQNKHLYRYISRGIYRGYINDKSLKNINLCYSKWIDLSRNSNKNLQSQLYFRHEISYRIYRSWEDFEEYNLESIEELKNEVIKNEI